MIQDTAARFCPFCGKPIAASDTAFCAYCGRALVTAQQASNAAPTSAPSVPPASSAPPANSTLNLINYGPAAYPPAQPPVMPMGASGYPMQPGMGAPAMPTPYYYPGMRTPPAGSAAPSAERMLGVMLGVVGVLLLLMGMRLLIVVMLLRGYSPWLYTLIGTVVLVVPLCYWLALLRLRAVSLARLIPEALLASVVFIFARAFIADLMQFLLLRFIHFFRFLPLFYNTHSLLTVSGFVFGVFLPLVIGVLIGVGAGFLFTRWDVINRLPAQMPGRAVLHFALVCGSFIGFSFLNAVVLDTLPNLLLRIVFGFVIDAAFAVGVVIFASMWMRGTLLRALPYQGAIPAARAAQPTPVAPFAGANPMPAAPSFPAQPSPLSAAPTATPPPHADVQTPPTQTQA